MTAITEHTANVEKNAGFDYDRLLDCIHCGLCLTSCPSYAVLGSEADSPRGRLFLMKAVADGRIEPDAVMKKHLDLCLNCRGCETACPSGVVYHPLFERAQEQVREKFPPSVAGGAISRVILEDVFPYPGRLRTAMRVMQVYQRTGLQTIVRKTGLLKIVSKKLDAAERFLPRITFKTENPPEPDGKTALKKAGFLRGCIMDYFFPETNAATLRVLRKCGYEAVIPEKAHCCGAVHLHNGDPDGARKLARALIGAYEKAGVDVIVTNAAGCGAMMKEYGELFADDLEFLGRAAAFAGKVRDISEFLVDKTAGLSFFPVMKSVVYDDPCHLIHAQKISAEPRILLGRIPGLDVRPLCEAEMCCGSAGTFNIVQPELSLGVIRRKMEHIRDSGAEAVVTGNVGCMIQFQRGRDLLGMDLDIYHTIDLLDRSLSSGK